MSFHNEDYRGYYEEQEQVAEAVKDALELQKFFARQAKIPEMIEADEVMRSSFRPARKKLETSTYRPSRNARKPFIGCRTLRTGDSDYDRLELQLVAVDLYYDASEITRRIRIG